MTTDFRALCAELADAYLRLLEHINNSTWLGYEPSDDPLLLRARAALADEPAVPKGREPASVTGQPSDEDLLGIACQSIEPYDKIRPGEYEAETNCAIEVYGSELVTFARTVLARWGRPAHAPPADGEVAELVAWLREIGDTIQPSHLAEHQRYKRAVLARWGSCQGFLDSSAPAPAGEVGELIGKLVEVVPALAEMGWDQHAQRILRAADLLQRLSPSQPVPVSERLTGQEVEG